MEERQEAAQSSAAAALRAADLPPVSVRFSPFADPHPHAAPAHKTSSPNVRPLPFIPKRVRDCESHGLRVRDLVEWTGGQPFCCGGCTAHGRLGCTAQRIGSCAEPMGTAGCPQNQCGPLYSVRQLTPAASRSIAGCAGEDAGVHAPPTGGGGASMSRALWRTARSSPHGPHAGLCASWHSTEQ